MSKSCAVGFKSEVGLTTDRDLIELYLFSVPPPDKPFFKVGSDARPQSTRVWQNPKIPLAPSVPTKGGALEARKQTTNNW